MSSLQDRMRASGYPEVPNVNLNALYTGLDSNGNKVSEDQRRKNHARLGELLKNYYNQVDKWERENPQLGKEIADGYTKCFS